MLNQEYSIGMQPWYETEFVDITVNLYYRKIMRRNLEKNIGKTGKNWSITEYGKVAQGSI